MFYIDIVIAPAVLQNVYANKNEQSKLRQTALQSRTRIITVSENLIKNVSDNPLQLVTLFRFSVTDLLNYWELIVEMWDFKCVRNCSLV